MGRFFLPFMTVMLIKDSLIRLPGSAHAAYNGGKITPSDCAFDKPSHKF